MKIIVLADAKGVTGKTAVAVNLSLRHGKRVLGIDLVPQGSRSKFWR